MFHNSVLPNDLDHELSWQYKGGDGRSFDPSDTDETRRLKYEQEEQDFRRQRAEVEADLSVARTALAGNTLVGGTCVCGWESSDHDLLNHFFFFFRSLFFGCWFFFLTLV
jgi:hypothetical protein